MKNIIFYNPSFETGGVEGNIKKYFDIINQTNKFKITFISTDRKLIQKKIKNIKVVPTVDWKLSSRYLKYLISFYYLILESWKGKSIIFSFQNNIFAIIAAIITGSRIIVRLNTSPNKYIKSSISKKIFRFFYSKADIIIVNDEDFKSKVKSFFKIDSIVVHNSVEIKKISKKAKFFLNGNFFNNKILNLVTVGRLTEQKDHLTILKGLNLIKKKINFRLMIIGSGNEENNLRRFIDKNELNSRIKIKGFLKNPYPYIKRADIFILSSLYEGSPNVLLEAGALKTLIISTNCNTGPKQILSSGKGGHLFETSNFKQLSEILIKINVKDKKSKKMKSITFNKIKKYNYHNQKKLLLRAINNIQ